MSPRNPPTTGWAAPGAGRSPHRPLFPPPLTPAQLAAFKAWVAGRPTFASPGRVVEFRITERVAPNFHQGIMNSPFDVIEWSVLDARDVEYWQPATLGEALFNFWD